ncbi:hypothetical protein [Bradyrhizobium sp. DASA03007]|uniref:hypothetical protein n=1 Tax=unclassified Bradyrhizobium TaxID=2631580 RepID=UPI003F70BC46
MIHDQKRARAVVLNEGIRQQRSQVLNGWQPKNFSEIKREVPEEPLPPAAQPPDMQTDLPKRKELTMGLPHLVIVGADKGGVGKTVVARTVLDYFKSVGVDARAIDTQMPAGNLIRFHKDVTEVVDLSSSNGQIKVFDSLPKHAVTVIDIQAGLLSPTLTLLSEIGLLSMVQDGKMNVTTMQVIGSTVQSLGEIEGAAKILAGSRHFIVKNHTNDAAFFAGLNVATDAMKAGTALIDIAKLDERATEYVEASATSFSDYAKNGDSFVMKGKVGHWLKGVFAQYDLAKLHIA